MSDYTHPTRTIGQLKEELRLALEKAQTPVTYSMLRGYFLAGVKERTPDVAEVFARSSLVIVSPEDWNEIRLALPAGADLFALFGALPFLSARVRRGVLFVLPDGAAQDAREFGRMRVVVLA